MKVKELIIELSMCDEDASVKVRAMSHLMTVDKVKEKKDVYGETIVILEI